jgi:hypothetical protein
MVRVSPTGNPQEVPKPAAYSFREIRLHEDVNNDAFERFMIGELFQPSIRVIMGLDATNTPPSSG